MINDIPASDATGLDDYLKALWRRKHFVVALTVIGLIIVVVYAGSLTRQYTARSQVVVTSLPNENTFAGVNLEAERALLSGNVLTERAIAAAKSSLSVADLQQDMDVSFVPDSDVLRVEVKSVDAESAQTLANALVTTYVTDRIQKQTDYYTKQIASLNVQLAELKTQIDPLTATINQLTVACRASCSSRRRSG